MTLPILHPPAIYHTPYPIRTGNGVTHTQYEHEMDHVIERNPWDRAFAWPNLLKWAITPIALLFLPIFLLAVVITCIYQNYVHGLDFQGTLAKFLILPVLQLDKQELTVIRNQIHINTQNADELTPDQIRISNLNIARNIRAELTQQLAAHPSEPTVEERVRRFNPQPFESFIKLTTSDNIELDALLSQTLKQEDRPIQEQQWMIYFNGVQSSYETSHQKVYNLTHGAQINTLAFNYRGVGASKGESLCKDDLIKDGESAIQYLLTLGVPEKNILLYGHSLGGGVAAAVGRNHPKVSYVNDRSFKDLISAVRTLFWLPFYRDLIAWAAEPFWDINTLDNIQYIEGHRFLVIADQDFIIDLEESSLYAALRKLPINLHRKIHHLHQEIDRRERSYYDLMHDYSMTHCYDIPGDSFKTLITPWLRDDPPPPPWLTGTRTLAPQ